jgi:hypothetical protein
MINPYLFGVPAVAARAGYGVVSAQNAEVNADRARSEVQQIEQRFDRLILVNMALWSLLQEKTGLTEQDLLDRVQEIDLADGQLDGKARKPVVKCPDCDRVMSSRHKRCLYCGAERLDHSAFDSAR